MRAVVVVGLLAAGCLNGGPALQVPPDYEADGLRAFVPPAMYSEWFQEVKECLGVEDGDVAEVTFGRAKWIKGRTGEFLIGVRYGNSIALAQWATTHEKWVKHEMLHYLLDVNGAGADGAHESDVWLRCTGT